MVFMVLFFRIVAADDNSLIDFSERHFSEKSFTENVEFPSENFEVLLHLHVCKIIFYLTQFDAIYFVYNLIRTIGVVR